MGNSIEELAALLLKWQATAQPLKVLFSDKDGTREHSGKISHVRIGEFDVAWDDGKTEIIKYSPASYYAVAEDGQTLNITYASGDGVILYPT